MVSVVSVGLFVGVVLLFASRIVVVVGGGSVGVVALCVGLLGCDSCELVAEPVEFRAPRMDDSGLLRLFVSLAVIEDFE